MWWPDGFSGDTRGYYSIFNPDYPEKIQRPNNRRFFLLTEKYGISVLPFEGRLDALSLDPAYASDAEEGILSNLIPFGTIFSILRKGEVLPQEGARWLRKYDVKGHNEFMNPLRWIESCRVLQRFDLFGLSFKEDDQILGRLEVTSLPDYFVLRTEIYPQTEEEFLGVRLELTFGQDFSVEQRDGKISLVRDQGDGFVLVPLTEGVTLHPGAGKIGFERKAVCPSKVFSGFSVAVYPIKNAESAPADPCLVRKIRAEAEQIFPQQKRQKFEYDPDYGYWKLSGEGTFSYQYGLLREEENLKKMDRILFSLENPTDQEVNVPIMVERSTEDDFNPTGMCPMIRDAETGIPTGELIQRTNNWHLFNYDPESFFYAPAEDPRRKWQGIWYHGHAVIRLKPFEKRKLEYTCTYATWGKGAFPVSHAQLSLIGYCGNQLWDQSALACFGESVCYDPETCLGRGNIDDVRPFQMDCGGRCEWTGNVGGGDFVFYTDQQGRKKLAGVRTYYRAQGPNMTDVLYQGKTIGGNISAKIRVRMGRTDDVVRIYYELDYRFEKDTTFDRLVFFQIGADNYASRKFDGFACGNEDGIIRSCGNLEAMTESVSEVRGENPWWFFNRNSSGEKGNLMAVVREFEAEENGQKVPLCYRIGRTFDGYEQSCLELVPHAKNFVEAGARYRFLIEFLVLPGSRKDYYGKSEYLCRQTDFDHPDFALFMCRGNRLVASATKGVIKSVYPVVVQTEAPDAESTVAELEFSGGLGYTPLVFERVLSPRAELQKKCNGRFERIDQSLYGNDFWQCSLEDDGYRLIYNVKEGGLYRLILKEKPQ